MILHVQCSIFKKEKIVKEKKGNEKYVFNSTMVILLIKPEIGSKYSVNKVLYAGL